MLASWVMAGLARRRSIGIVNCDHASWQFSAYGSGPGAGRLESGQDGCRNGLTDMCVRWLEYLTGGDVLRRRGWCWGRTVLVYRKW